MQSLNQQQSGPTSTGGLQVPQALAFYQNGRIVRPGFNGKTAKLLGALLVATGLFLIVFQITAIVVHIYFFTLASGVWGGVMAIIAGSFGFTSAQRQTNCLIIAYMVLSILTAVFCAIPVMTSVAGLASHHTSLYGRGHHSALVTLESVTAIYAMILIIALLMIVLSVWSSAVCCKAVCCGPGSSGYDMSYQVQYVAAAQGMPQQVVIMTPPSQGGGLAYTPSQATGLTYTLPAPNQASYSVPQVTIPLQNLNQQVQSPVVNQSPMHGAQANTEAPPAYCPLLQNEEKTAQPL